MFHECEARYPAAHPAGLESDGYLWVQPGALARLLHRLGFTDV